MFSLTLLNENVRSFLNISRLSDLIRFQSVSMIASYISAAKVPEFQQDQDSVRDILADTALNHVLDSNTRVPVYPQRRTTLHTLILYLKEKMGELVELYHGLGDPESRNGLLHLICGVLFENEDLLREAGDPMLLICRWQDEPGVQSISSILDAWDRLKAEADTPHMYLRYIVTADHAVDIRIFTEDPEQAILSTIDRTISCADRKIDEMIKTVRAVENALQLAKQLMGNGQIADALPVFKICDTTSQALSEVMQKYYIPEER